MMSKGVFAERKTEFYENKHEGGSVDTFNAPQLKGEFFCGPHLNISE